MQCVWDYNRGGVVEKRQLGWQFVGAAPRLAVIPCWSRESERTPMKSFLFSRTCMSVLVATLATVCASRAVAASQAGAASAAPGASAAQTAAASASAADAWPRIFESGGFTVTVCTHRHLSRGMLAPWPVHARSHAGQLAARP